MLGKQEIKQLCRTPLRTLAFCLALCVVIGLVNVTVGMKLATEQAVADVDEQYTTVAVFPRIEAQYFATHEAYTQASTKASELYLALFNPLSSDTLQLEGVSAVDKHSHLLAYSDHLLPVTSEYLEAFDVRNELNRPNNLALLSVKCIDFSELGRGGAMGYQQGNMNYSYRFTVNRVELMHEDYTRPQEIWVESAINAKGTKPLFEIGENYWIWGYYEPTSNTSGKIFLPDSNAKVDLWETDRILYLDFPNSYNMQYSLPIVAEGDESTDLSAFWEKIVETVDIGVHSLRVVSADHVPGLLAFADGNTSIVSGEVFSEEDIAQGRQVAIISDLLAERNGLEVGDEIDLSFYHSLYYKGSGVVEANWQVYPSGLYGQSKYDFEKLSMKQFPMPATYNGTYTIVGIYSSDMGIVDDYRDLHPNTVLIPTALMGAHYSLTGYRELAYSFLIPNGGIEVLEEELATYGFEDFLEYYDGGYSAIMPHVKSMLDNTVFINNVVLVLWAIVVLAVLILFVCMQISAGRIKYRLGAGKGAIGREMTFTTVLTVLIAGVIGGLGSIVLYDKALAYMMQSNFTSFNTAFSTGSVNGEMLEQILTMLGQEPQFFVIASAVQIGILSILGAVICAIVSLRKTGFGR